MAFRRRSARLAKKQAIAKSVQEWNQAMRKILVPLALLAVIFLGANAVTSEWRETKGIRHARVDLASSPSPDRRDAETITWLRHVSEESREVDVNPPLALAIIACRVDEKIQSDGSAASNWRELEWHVPVECMRVIENLADAVALNNLWIEQLSPNLSQKGVCAEIGMAYAPSWEAEHKNWAIVKTGCPTKMMDDRGNIIGWHMPECQGMIPGTTYPLRCRFDPSEI
jgi:hypothetical protein